MQKEIKKIFITKLYNLDDVIVIPCDFDYIVCHNIIILDSKMNYIHVFYNNVYKFEYVHSIDLKTNM